MKFIPIILLFCSCSTLRHYQKVYDDKDRSEAERELLAKAAAEEFPPKIQYVKGKDTTVYRDTIIEIPGETIIDSFAIPCPDYEYSGPKVQVVIREGKGKVTCKADSIQKKLDSVIRETSRIDTLIKSDSINAYLRRIAEEKNAEYEKNEKNLGYILGLLIKWFTRQWWFWALVALAIVYLLFRFQIIKGQWIGRIVSGLKSWLS